MLNSDATECNATESDGTECDATECDATEYPELKIEVNQTSYSYGTYVAASVGVMSSVGASVARGGSPKGAWAMINQLQALVLLPLMFEGFSDRIKNYILCMDAALFTFNFITIKDVLPDQLTKKVEFDQPNIYLKLTGLEDGSAFINNLALSVIIL